MKAKLKKLEDKAGKDGAKAAELEAELARLQEDVPALQARASDLELQLGKAQEVGRLALAARVGDLLFMWVCHGMGMPRRACRAGPGASGWSLAWPCLSPPPLSAHLLPLACLGVLTCCWQPAPWSSLCCEVKGTGKFS